MADRLGGLQAAGSKREYKGAESRSHLSWLPLESDLPACMRLQTMSLRANQGMAC